jgi:hypothetical protein
MTIRQAKKTTLALKEVSTGKIHYFDYVVDYREALQQADETGKRRFIKAEETPNKLVNPKGEEVFEKPEEKIRRGRPPKTTSVAEVIEEPETDDGAEVENTKEQ